MADANSILLHASCVSIDKEGVLLIGESGSGKSDLALRLIDDGAILVSDDQVQVAVQNNTPFASAPESLAGMIEARGIGVLTLPYVQNIPLVVVVSLVPRNAVARLPDPDFFDCLGQRLPLLSLHAFDHSTPAKIRFYLQGRS